MAKLAPDAAARAAELVAALRAGEPIELVGILGRCRLQRAGDIRNPGLYCAADEGALERLLPGLPESAWELLAVSDRPVIIEDEVGRSAVLETDAFAAYVLRGAGGICAVHSRADLPELRVRFDRHGRFTLLEG